MNKVLVVLTLLVISTILSSLPTWTITHESDGRSWTNRNGSKFIAVGCWGVPGYTFDADSTDANNYANARKIYNIITHPSAGNNDAMYPKPFMYQSTYNGQQLNDQLFLVDHSGITYFVNNAGQTGFQNYGVTTPISTSGWSTNRPWLSPQDMLNLRTDIHKLFDNDNSTTSADYPAFRYSSQAIYNKIMHNTTVNHDCDMVQMLFDEPERPHYSVYSWTPEIMRAMNRASKNKCPGRLTFLGFGPTNGNMYFWEQNYSANHSGTLPTTLPAYNTDTTWGGQPITSANFDSAPGTYIMRYNGDRTSYYSGTWPNGTWLNNTLPYSVNYLYQYDTSTLQNYSTSYNNYIFRAAYNLGLAYRDSVDIMAINDYNVNSTFVPSVGFAVDGMRQATNKPIWVWLDGGYTMYSSTSYTATVCNEFYTKLRGKAYTALMHGATGILFYRSPGVSGQTLNPDIQAKVDLVAKDIADKSWIFKGTVTSSYFEWWTQVVTYDCGTAGQYVVMVNTDTSASHWAYYLDQSAELAPYEVVIKRLPDSTEKFSDIVLVNNNSLNQIDVIPCNGFGLQWDDKATWWSGSTTTCDLNRVKFACRGDFDNDGIGDLLLTYFDDSAVGSKDIFRGVRNKFLVLASNGSNHFRFMNNTTTITEPLIASEFELTQNVSDFRIQSVTTGDFDNDGYIDDVAVVYKDEDGVQKISILYSNGSAFESANGTSCSKVANACVLTNTSTSYNTSYLKKVVSGDFGQTNSDDLIMLYNDGSNSKVLALYTNSSKTLQNSSTTVSSDLLSYSLLNFSNANLPLSEIVNVNAGKYYTSSTNDEDDLVLYRNTIDDNNSVMVWSCTKNGNSSTFHYLDNTAISTNTNPMTYGTHTSVLHEFVYGDDNWYSFDQTIQFVSGNMLMDTNASLAPGGKDELVWLYNQNSAAQRIIALDTVQDNRGLANDYLTLEDRWNKDPVFYQDDARILSVAQSVFDITKVRFAVLSNVMSSDARGVTDDNTPVAGGKLKAQNYPNPFNPETTISFDLPVSGATKLCVFNVRGQKIATLLNETMDKGAHTVTWKGTDTVGNRVSSGVYFYRLESSGKSITNKMLLVK